MEGRATQACDPGMDDPGPPPSEWIGAEYAYDVEGPPHAVTSVTRPTSTDTYLYDTDRQPPSETLSGNRQAQDSA